MEIAEQAKDLANRLECFAMSDIRAVPAMPAATRTEILAALIEDLAAATAAATALQASLTDREDTT